MSVSVPLSSQVSFSPLSAASVEALPVLLVTACLAAPKLGASFSDGDTSSNGFMAGLV